MRGFQFALLLAVASLAAAHTLPKDYEKRAERKYASTATVKEGDQTIPVATKTLTLTYYTSTPDAVSYTHLTLPTKA